MKKIGLISDTHGHLDPRVFEHFKDVDEIWHAGDIGNLQVTDELKKFKPLKAVYGNIDGHEARAEFPEIQRFLCEEVDVMMIHIGGKPYVYTKDLREYLKKNPPDLFICGHSHILRVEMDKRWKFLCMNPGAAGIHGFHKVRTLLRFTIAGKKVTACEAIELGPRA